MTALKLFAVRVLKTTSNTLCESQTICGFVAMILCAQLYTSISHVRHIFTRARLLPLETGFKL